MKIAIITETFLPSTDGVVTRLCATIKWLQEHRHTVWVIAPDLGTSVYEGAQVKGIPAHTFFFYKDRKFSMPSHKVKKYLQEFQPDIVHVVNPALLGVAGIYFAKRLHLPLIASYHTNIPQYVSYYRLAFLEPVLWQFFRTLHNQAVLNLCTSDSVKKELMAKKFHNVKLWIRGVAIDQFGPQYYDRTMRESLTNGQAEKTLLLYVGRLAFEKQIEKIRDVLKASDDFCLALVGDGPYRQELEQYFQGTNTVFKGFLHGEELAKAYASSDIFVFPSTTETLGLVILEAMASGLPVVAAKSGPTCEQISDGFGGLLFDPDDPDSFKNTVLKLAGENLRWAMAKNAYEVGHSFSWEKPSEQLLSFYEQVLAKQPSE